MLWFLDTLVDIPVSHENGTDGISIVDSRAAYGDSPPYHVHHTEDEAFHVVEGELAILLDGDLIRLRAGETICAPRGIPHTYCVVSQHARWLAVTTKGDFERFVREASRPAEAPELPPHSGPPTDEQQRALAELCRRHGIELIGAPLAAETVEAA